jgi:hypothetical protein
MERIPRLNGGNASGEGIVAYPDKTARGQVGLARGEIFTNELAIHI